MILPQNSALVVVDAQERLMPVIHCNEVVSRNISTLVQGMNVLQVPVLCTEQYPERLGSTIADIKCHLRCDPLPKLTFSCFGVEEFNTALDTVNRTNIIVVGVETHVCVLQTVLDLLARGYSPYVVADAVSSRTEQNKEIAISRMAAEGARIVSVEMVLFELLGKAEGDSFKQILQLIK